MHDDDDEDDVIIEEPPEPQKRKRKDSFRIVQVVDSVPISKSTINECEEVDEEPRKHHPMLQRTNRIGSVDSGSMMNRAAPVQRDYPGENRMHLRSTSVDMYRPPPLSKSNSSAAWKQLNDDLNHIFPMTTPKKNSYPSIPKSPIVGMSNNSSRLELRKSSSRSSLYNEGDLESEDDQMYHTVHLGTGTGGRKNTMTISRNSEPFSKLMRRRNGEVEDPNLHVSATHPAAIISAAAAKMSNASSMHNLHELETPTPTEGSFFWPNGVSPWAKMCLSLETNDDRRCTLIDLQS